MILKFTKSSISGNLADLEEISPSLGRPSCEAIFSESINADRSVYSNHHVYPYTYQAGYYYRKKNYVKALQVWAGAADVIKLWVLAPLKFDFNYIQNLYLNSPEQLRILS